MYTEGFTVSAAILLPHATLWDVLWWTTLGLLARLIPGTTLTSTNNNSRSLCHIILYQLIKVVEKYLCTRTMTPGRLEFLRVSAQHRIFDCDLFDCWIVNKATLSCRCTETAMIISLSTKYIKPVI